MTALNDLIEKDKITDFASRLVKVPSESGQEQEIAKLIEEEMKELGYDEVFVDKISNVIGRIKGSGGGKTLLLAGHIDHAEPGTMQEPYSGKIIDGDRFGLNEKVLYGRAAVDMKGAIASMVYAGAAIKKSGIPIKGDLIVACNPLEEVSAAEGTLYMLEVDKITADMSVCGEATCLNLYLGHRGNAEIKIVVKGQMSHASNPKNGINAAQKACELTSFLMKNYSLPSHPLLGDCTVTVLDIKADTNRKAPVMPDLCEVYIDRRFLPGETKEDILNETKGLIEKAKKEIKDLSATCEITKWGIALYTPEEEEIAEATLRAREKVMGDRGKVSAWIFGTDGAFVADHGIPTIGFGPGDESYAHTPNDHIPLSHLEIAAKVYAQMAADICCQDKN